MTDTAQALHILADWRRSAAARAFVCGTLGAVMLPVLPVSVPLLTYAMAAACVAFLALMLGRWLEGVTDAT